jgi:hypothetical protein
MPDAAAQPSDNLPDAKLGPVAIRRYRRATPLNDYECSMTINAGLVPHCIIAGPSTTIERLYHRSPGKDRYGFNKDRIAITLYPP